MRQKFSIRKRLLAAVAVTLVLAAAPARSDEIQVNEQVPDRYTVQKGDTLWGISGRFLKQPWRWPEIWRLNRDQIKNPHWIYPGDVVVLDKDAGQWRLRVERPVTKLSPTVRVQPLDADAVPSIPPGDIEPYLTKPLITGTEGLVGACAGGDRNEHEREDRDQGLPYAKLLTHKASSGGGGTCGAVRGGLNQRPKPAQNKGLG